MNRNRVALMSAVAGLAVLVPSHVLGSTAFSNLSHLTRFSQSFLPDVGGGPVNNAVEFTQLGEFNSDIGRGFARGIITGPSVVYSAAAIRGFTLGGQSGLYDERATTTVNFDVATTPLLVNVFAELQETNVYIEYRLERVRDAGGNLLAQPQSVVALQWLYGSERSPIRPDPLGVEAFGVVSQQVTLTPGGYRLFVDIDSARFGTNTAINPFGPQSGGGSVATVRLDVVPTPGAGVMLAGGMLMAMRRRR
jgi:hypothetical protein